MNDINDNNANIELIELANELADIVDCDLEVEEISSLH